MNLDEVTATSAEHGPTLTMESLQTRLLPPYQVALVLRYPGEDTSGGERLMAGPAMADDSLVGRAILPGDLLIFDRLRTDPRDGAIVLIRHDDASITRIYRATPTGPEFHAAGGDYPPTVGAQRILGTLVAVVRVDGNQEGGSL
jgi:hypothetical protein